MLLDAVPDIRRMQQVGRVHTCPRRRGGEIGARRVSAYGVRVAGPVPDAGVQVACPSCGRTVYQKSMIPVLDGSGPGIVLICRDCARDLRPAFIKETSPVERTEPAA